MLPLYLNGRYYPVTFEAFPHVPQKNSPDSSEICRTQPAFHEAFKQGVEYFFLPTATSNHQVVAGQLRGKSEIQNKALAFKISINSCIVSSLPGYKCFLHSSSMIGIEIMEWQSIKYYQWSEFELSNRATRSKLIAILISTYTFLVKLLSSRHFRTSLLFHIHIHIKKKVRLEFSPCRSPRIINIGLTNRPNLENLLQSFENTGKTDLKEDQSKMKLVSN